MRGGACCRCAFVSVARGRENGRAPACRKVPRAQPYCTLRNARQRTSMRAEARARFEAGDVDSWGAPAEMRRRSEEKLGGGEALDKLHGSSSSAPHTSSDHLDRWPRNTRMRPPQRGFVQVGLWSLIHHKGAGRFWLGKCPGCMISAWPLSRRAHECKSAEFSGAGWRGVLQHRDSGDTRVGCGRRERN